MIMELRSYGWEMVLDRNITGYVVVAYNDVQIKGILEF